MPQWRKVPEGASGSSTINAKLFVPAGGSAHSSGGERSCPSAVYLAGMVFSRRQLGNEVAKIAPIDIGKNSADHWIMNGKRCGKRCDLRIRIRLALGKRIDDAEECRPPCGLALGIDGVPRQPNSGIEEKKRECPDPCQLFLERFADHHCIGIGCADL